MKVYKSFIGYSYKSTNYISIISTNSIIIKYALFLIWIPLNVRQVKHFQIFTRYSIFLPSKGIKTYLINSINTISLMMTFHNAYFHY